VVGLVLILTVVPVAGAWSPESGRIPRRSGSPAAVATGRFASLAISGVLGATASLQPLENQLSAGTTNLLRTIRKRVRLIIRRLRYGAAIWSTWLGGLVLFLVVALIIPLLGRDNLRTFREQGFLAFARELSLALAVYVRLLIDSRTPVIGKALLAFAVVYGAAPRDLFPDRFALLYFVDDLVLLVLASRSFMMLCPQETVEEHALAAAHAREENLRKKLSRRRSVKGPASSSTATESNG
jgi:uncharacterized membrane protein YkvA (DUF1232 family)